MNRFSTFLLCGLVYILSACEAVFQADLSTESSGDTRLNIRLTDDPIDLEAVNIDLQRVRVKGENGFEEIDLETNAGIYNLLDFQNGLDTLIATADLSMGRIKEVRLILGNNNSVISAGETYDLKIPSGSQSGIKIKTCLVLDDLPDFDLLLDFDAAASIHCTGNGKFIMHPVIRILSADARCGAEEGEDLDNLPQAVLDSLANNYAGYDFEVDIETLCDSTDVYAITATMDGQLELLYFELEEGEFVQSGTPIEDESIPEAILQALVNDFPSYELIPGSALQIQRASGEVWFSVDLGVELDRLEVIYSLEGTFICGIARQEDHEEEEENEEEENDENSDNQVPEGVSEFLAMNYTGYQFESQVQVSCDSTSYFVLSGKKGPDRIRLYFDLDWNLVQVGTQIDESQIPAAVQQSLELEYPNFRIMNNKTWAIENSEEEKFYRTYLKQDHSSLKIYVVYHADGTFICREE